MSPSVAFVSRNGPSRGVVRHLADEVPVTSTLEAIVNQMSTPNPDRRNGGPYRHATIVATVIAVLLAVIAGAAPARAAYSIVFTPTGGSVGTPIALTSTVSNGGVGVGVGMVTYFAGGTSVATAAVDATGTVAPASWTPTTAGSVAMYAVYTSNDGTQAPTLSTTTVTITKGQSVTTLTMPATAKLGATVPITATVTAGLYVPTGSVTFLLPGGTILTAANLDAKGIATISVQMPSQPATYQLTARYNPDDNTTGSTSTTGTTLVTTTGSTVALSVPTSTPLVGTPVTLTAAITPSTATGTVTFQVGTTVLGAATVTGGTATWAWTPAATGTVTLTATYREAGSAVVSGTNAISVTVATSLPADRITIGPTGQAAWAPGAAYPLRNSASVTVTAASQSGAAVTLAVAGPCSLNGLTIRATAGAGSCTVTSSSPGTSAFGGGTQTNTLTLAPGVQTATLTPPAPGTLTRGNYYRLAGPGTVTTAGNPVTWRVTSGAKRCKVLKQADGSYLLQARKPGRCTVRAYARPVAGQWLTFTKLHRYTVRR